MDYFSLLPVELLHELFIYTPLSTIIELCIHNLYFIKFCNDKNIWKQRLKSLYDYELLPRYEVKKDALNEVRAYTKFYGIFAESAKERADLIKSQKNIPSLVWYIVALLNIRKVKYRKEASNELREVMDAVEKEMRTNIPSRIKLEYYLVSYRSDPFVVEARTANEAIAKLRSYLKSKINEDIFFTILFDYVDIITILEYWETEEHATIHDILDYFKAEIEKSDYINSHETDIIK